MPHQRWIRAVMGAALAVSAVTIPADAAPPPDHAEPAQVTARVTLITGDRVRVTSRPGKPELVGFEPDRHSRSDSAITTYSGGHTYVIPSAAAADVATGRLDRTLFDVTTLIAEGQDDKTSATLPVIIRYAGTPAAARGRADQAKIPGATKSRVLTSLGARAATVKKSSTGEFWRSLTSGTSRRVAAPIERVTLDRKVSVKLDQSVPQIGGPAAWQRGLTGKGVKVAVLDTGIDPEHPDFAGRIAQAENFSDAADSVDRFGHGTHVAGISAGSGAASRGKYKGVAPEATLLNGKVLDDEGSGWFSGIIAGMEWATAQGAVVVNLSLGSGFPSDGTDELSQAVNRLSKQHGTLFIVAAGNCSFPRPAAITSPAAADEAVAVGNQLRDGALNDSSCRGPRKRDGALKPEISAPGTDIVAARAASAKIGQPVDDHYSTLTGTSMATPHVAGTAALIAQAHPDWKSTQLRARLIAAADPQPGSRVDEQGAGRVDADQATDPGTITTDTGELELGKLVWPHPASDPVTRDITYTNPTSTPVTLQLAASLDQAAATPKLSATQLVVPANGQAKVTVTADRAGGGTGTFSGRITATPTGADPIITTIGWYAEPEMYDLTVKGITHNGEPADGDFVISRLDGAPLRFEPGETQLTNGTATVRLPPGRYEVSSVFYTDPTDERPQQFDLVTSAEVDLHKNNSATLDARTATSAGFRMPSQPGLTARQRGFGYLRTNTAGEVAGGTGVSSTGTARIFRATPSAKATTGSSEFSMHARLEVPPYRAAVVGGDAFTVHDYYFGPRFTGTKDLQVYDAGTATADELKGARGKLALIRDIDTDSRQNGVLVKAAQDAGAVAAILYNPDAPGDGGVLSYWVTGDGDSATIPAMRTSRKAAQSVLEAANQKPVTVRVTGQAATPYVYDLARPWADQIPANAEVAVSRDQLARVDETFGTHKAGMPTSETRHALTPSGVWFGGWLAPTFSTPARRTSYLLANQTKWSSFVVHDNGGGGQVTPTSSAERTYRAGEHSSIRWLAPVMTSGLPADATVQGAVERLDGGLRFQVAPYQHQQEFAETDGNHNSELTLSRDGEHLTTVEDTAVWVEVPDGPAEYKATLLARRENAVWKHSTRVKSDWTFKSRGGKAEVMPIIFADLDVPQADAFGRVAAGKPTLITFGLRHQAGSGSTAKFTGATLELSYDGTQWTELPLVKVGDGKYVTTVNHPLVQGGKAPSLRLTAKDAEGNALTQEITKAYGLK